MNKKFIALIVCLAFILTAAIAFAGPYDREIADQQRAIDRGKASGKLTHNEAATVQDNLNHIKGRLDQFRGNDGRLDRRERASIEKMLQRNDRMIRRLKNNSIQRVY